MQAKIFQLGDWLVDSESCTLTHDAAPKPVPVEPRAMDVLVALCRQAGDVLSADELLRLCWDGVIVGENQVHKAIAQLRRILGDSAGSARYIENIRKRGYRTVAPVRALPGARASAGAGSWSNGSPFVGLDPFSETHSAVFFGRDEATARLREAVITQVYAGRALVLVFGPSGSGKTSLVQAGLLPALRRSDQGFQLVGTTTLDLGDIGESISPYPYVLNYPQDAHEAMLEEELAKLNVKVERNTILTSFLSGANYVQAQLQKSNGEVEKCEAAWLAELV